MNEATKKELDKRWESMGKVGTNALSPRNNEINSRSNVPAFTRRKKEIPTVLKEYPDLVLGNSARRPTSVFKVRLIKYINSPALFDIREWVNHPTVWTDEFGNEKPPYQGFGKRGIAFPVEALYILQSVMSDVIPRMNVTNHEDS